MTDNSKGFKHFFKSILHPQQKVDNKGNRLDVESILRNYGKTRERGKIVKGSSSVDLYAVLNKKKTKKR